MASVSSSENASISASASFRINGTIATPEASLSVICHQVSPTEVNNGFEFERPSKIMETLVTQEVKQTPQNLETSSDVSSNVHDGSSVPSVELITPYFTQSDESDGSNQLMQTPLAPESTIQLASTLQF